ncbi:hypothetical protein GCM10011371_09430 [Novosphingobium marinum]|uniref:Alpha/beta hydrolase n=1 Tax=Novosphingobium marinum TaxID=1514948 RepID=A0A7Y9XUY2_9SPHN|nr:alpha/beta hydrolase [Novosphingobium marinum]NYH95049.1 hypothetical protein [Novosphingobium marinum]GGC23901.1 hypothetical protein GCM10011371_09430 [Novosphingobium marinum]
MRYIFALATFLVAFAALPASAQTVVYEEVVVGEVWVAAGGERFVAIAPVEIPEGIAAYGPFRVLDERRAALVDVTGASAPAHFRAMIAEHPGIELLEMIECPGTEDDLANLAVGRMIRERGMTTYVPAGGSVRSGAVELFLAGARRIADEGAEFAVHAWMDEEGREATEYGMAAPENRRYLDYYRAMGMSPEEAASFYAMTNSAPHADARWLDAAEMALWVRLDRREVAVADLDSLPLLQ